jgi:NADH-quinone oxidoreductase subunit N
MNGMPPTTAGLLPLLPLLALSAGLVAVLLAAHSARGRGAVALLSAAAYAGALLSLAAVVPRLPAAVSDLFVIDRLAAAASGLVLLASLCIAVLAQPYLAQQEAPQAEFTLLLMLATLGGLVLLSASHFVSLFLGIELIGIPLSALAAYLRHRQRSIEAGFKYLVLSGVSSAVLLFGAALLYAETGSLTLDLFRSAAFRLPSLPPVAYIGLAMLISGLAFKLAVVPFHFWAPDVYEGAAAPAAIFASTVSKAAVITVLLRIFPPGAASAHRSLFLSFAVLSVLSMTVGNLLALRQRNVKRMLAWSAIAHNGYLLVAFLSPGASARAAVLLYLLAEVAAHVAAFGVVTLLSGRGGDAEDLDDFAGLAWRSPWAAAAFTAALLSLLGLPLTAGFFAKFTIAAAGLDAGLVSLVVLLLLNTVIGAVYYLRVIMVLFLGPDEVRVGAIRHADRRLPAAGLLVVLAQAALLVWIGVTPQFFLGIIQWALQ